MFGTGQARVATIPVPMVRAGQVLIANVCSVISAGTGEGGHRRHPRKSLTWAQGVRTTGLRSSQVLQKVRSEGLFKTVSQVFEKLNEPIGMGYASAGVVLAAGAGVQNFKPGDRVASNGPHAGVVCVPAQLCSPYPRQRPLRARGLGHGAGVHRPSGSARLAPARPRRKRSGHRPRSARPDRRQTSQGPGLPCPGHRSRRGQVLPSRRCIGPPTTPPAGLRPSGRAT